MGDAPVELRAVVETADISEAMRAAAEAAAAGALRGGERRDGRIAAAVTKRMDASFGRGWHCFVGRDFGSSITHMPGHFIYFYIDKFAVVVYKAPPRE